AGDGVERRAQLMAGAGEELALAPVGGFRLVLGAGQRMLGLLARRDVEGDADDVDHFAGLAQRRLGGEEDARLALAVGDDLLDAGIDLAGGEDLGVELAVAMGIVLAEEFGRRPARRSLGLDAEEIALRLVDEDAI